MANSGKKDIKGRLKVLLSNIDEAERLNRDNESVKIAAVVSGNKAICRNWQERLKDTSAHIFNSDGSTLVLSLEEKIGRKDREGNFLGTLLAYELMKERAEEEKVDHSGAVSIIGMLFGRGERISPVTQASGCSKPCIKVTPARSGLKGEKRAFTAIEEALLYFTPVAKYLEKGGFKGALIKWGDQTEIASIDIKSPAAGAPPFTEHDMIKFISVMEITEEKAKHKEWVVFDDKGNMTAQVSRNERSVLVKELDQLGVKPDGHGRYYAGISLGPVAVSYAFLDIASGIFAEEIEKEGVYFDFDPYFLMALAMEDRHADKWDEIAARDKALQRLLKMVPDFFDKVQNIKKVFAERYGRPPGFKVLDLGSDVYWADIGQHGTMREKYMALREDGLTGEVSRRLAGISGKKDKNGNIIENSYISPEVDIVNSVVVGTRINGKGTVTGSVLIDSSFRDVYMDSAFSVRSARSGRTELKQDSGLYESIGTEDLILAEKERHVSVFTSKGKEDMRVSEDTDLRDRERTYNVPIMGNNRSFREVYDEMFGVSMDEIERRKGPVLKSIEKSIEKSGYMKPLKFGTSGLRDKVEFMTDKECYINSKGFISFLKERGETDGCGKIAIGGDRRESTPRIIASVIRAVMDSGLKPVYCGRVPSPTLAFYAMRESMPSIMVTGSHIPEDRNGIKFTKKSGEVLKSDEEDILRNVASLRKEEYAKKDKDSLFDGDGMFKCPENLPEETREGEAAGAYVERYTDVFGRDGLRGKKVVLYQHSAVGRDIVKDVFETLGAEVITVGRSERFVPVDTEKISEGTRALFKEWASEHEPFAIVSTDGDSDRPLLADEHGEFLTGDKLGALVSLFLEPDFAAVPVSSNDAVVSALRTKGIEVEETRIGSPYVIKAMMDELLKKPEAKVVGWEANGGFLLGSDWNIGGKKIKALPTRDAVLPLAAVMMQAIKEKKTVSELITSSLPARYTHADVIDDRTEGCGEYTAEMGKKIIAMFLPADGKIKEVFYDKGKREPGKGLEKIKAAAERYFGKDKGFDEIASMNFIDGVRITFKDGTVAHLRPSGNAPEFRLYATADTLEKAEEIVRKRTIILPEIIKAIASGTGTPRSLGAHAAGSEPRDNGVKSDAVKKISGGAPFYIKPYKEPKVWGVNGIGEYWYGAEPGEKSSDISMNGEELKASDVLNAAAEKILGKAVVKKFGHAMPLVKILTPKGRLSVQFHDSKNELWIITGIDETVAGPDPAIILGFSADKVKKYGEKVREHYGKALEHYAEALNGLIDMLESDEESMKKLQKDRDVLKTAAAAGQKKGVIRERLGTLMERRKELDGFYNYVPVKKGDVIPVPSGTLHALGQGIEIVEPQIAGPTQSLEDGETYPVRYYFPGFERTGAQKKLDTDRIGEMSISPVSVNNTEVIVNKEDTKIERLPGGFSDKGLEVHRITLGNMAEVKNADIQSFHNLVVISGKAKAIVQGKEYDLPRAVPGGEMFVIPASAGGYRLISLARDTRIIDTFTPV